MLLDAGADVNLRNKYKKIPLHGLLYFRDHKAEIAQLLLDAGSEVNARDRINRTALHEVGFRKVDNSEIIFALIGRGAEIDPRDVYGATPLRGAIIYRNALHTEIFVSFGASVEKAKQSSFLKNLFEERVNDDIIIAAIALGKSPMGEKWKNKAQQANDGSLV